MWGKKTQNLHGAVYGTRKHQVTINIDKFGASSDFNAINKHIQTSP